MQQRISKFKVYAMSGMMILALASLSYGPGLMSAGHSVTRINLSPTTPNILLNNQKVTIAFSYSTTQPGGVRIFARPFTGGSPTANYAASGAQLSPTGAGTGSQNFTISSGNVTVDQIRFQMLNADQTTVLFETFVPVHYEFRLP